MVSVVLALGDPERENRNSDRQEWCMVHLEVGLQGHSRRTQRGKRSQNAPRGGLDVRSSVDLEPVRRLGTRVHDQDRAEAVELTPVGLDVGARPQEPLFLAAEEDEANRSARLDPPGLQYFLRLED